METDQLVVDSTTVRSYNRVRRTMVTNVSVDFIKVHPGATLPTYAHTTDVGADLYAVEACTLYRDDTIVVRTGLQLADMDPAYELQIRSRSGLSKKGLIVANAPGTVDPSYRGEICVLLHYQGKAVRQDIAPGDRIAQMVIAPRFQGTFAYVTQAAESERGDGGFGSTGS